MDDNYTVFISSREDTLFCITKFPEVKLQYSRKFAEILAKLIKYFIK